MNWKFKYSFIILILIHSVLWSEIIAPGLQGQALLDYLAANYKTSVTLGYDTARDKMYGEIDLQPGNQLVCVYSGYTITISNLQDPRPEVNAQHMNCEHTWPQSLGADNEPMRSDLHHLYPTHEDVNASRGNNPFADIPDVQTDIWWYNGLAYYSIPATNIDLYSEKQQDRQERFECREDHKGNAARSIFYFYCMYSDVADEIFFQLQKDILRQWHNQDAASSAELARTWAIAAYQDNKPNPFVIDSTLVRRAWFWEEEQPVYDIVINEIHYNPSSVQGDDSDYEFLELFNAEDFSVDLSGHYFTSGIEHLFGGVTIEPQSYLILAKNAAFYPGSVQWDSGFLNNIGELLQLVNGSGSTVDSVNFDISAPWPSQANGGGPSLELLAPDLDNSLAASWAASLISGGTPGAANSVSGGEPQITVISPNGAEVWTIGNEYQILWTSQGYSGNVVIELLADGILYKELVAATPDTGAWSWLIGEDCAPGSAYTIRISAAADGDPSDVSDGYFTLSTGGSGGAEEVFFSEYIEGSSNNKAVELFNGTQETIDLGNYQIWRANNGDNWEDGYIFSLQGLLAAGDVWVNCNADADDLLKAVADSIGGGITWFNGDDALGLATTADGRDWYLIDVIGIAGQDPGDGWDVAGTAEATLNHTLVRKPAVTGGNTDWLQSAGTDSDNSEWLVYPQNDFSHLGSHEFSPPQPPGTPQNIVIAITAGICHLSWSPVAGATQYRIYSSSNPSGSRAWNFLAAVPDTTWSGTATQQKQFFRVTAEN